MNNKDLFDSFTHMADTIINDSIIYKTLEFTYTSSYYDYYVIIGFINDEDYDESRSIVLQMEPWVYDNSKNWGVKCWGKWSNPVVSKYFYVHRHKNMLNPAQWFVKNPKIIKLTDRKNKIIAIISGKYIDSGHINRVEFIRYVESLGYDIIDIYGYSNYHNFKNYRGTISDKSIMQEYKYILSAENNNEYNYATEKIWESFILGCLCFYDGCPNLSEYVDPLSYIQISLENKEQSLNTILEHINNNSWECRIQNILSAKEVTIKKYNFFEVINRIIIDKLN